jgi:hypothetical protein
MALKTFNLNDEKNFEYLFQPYPAYMPTKHLSPERYRNILLAAVDYMLMRYAPKAIVIDGQNHMVEHFKGIRERAEHLYSKGETKKLEKLFLKNTDMISKAGGKDFEEYARNTTLPDFSLDEIPEWKDPDMKEYRKVINSGNGIIIEGVIISTRSRKPLSIDDYTKKVLSEIVSPGGRYKARIHECGHGNTLTTQIDLQLPNGGGCGIYSTPGHGHAINVWWKDGHTIVLETPLGLMNNTKKMQQVQSGDELVVIERVEK